MVLGIHLKLFVLEFISLLTGPNAGYAQAAASGTDWLELIALSARSDT